MKNFQLGLVLLTVLTSPAARAAVVDGFSCDLSLKDKGGKILLQSSMELAAARRPLNESPRPGVLLTSANAEGNVKGALEKFSLSASFQLSYQHAVELDASSKPVQAAQSLCFAIGYEVCGPSSHGSATGAAPVMDCSWSSISCVSTA
ncbi:MAG: hypothetical protein HY074_18770, partial [Deltaproteobacteria bacterium]|nr:hypothetical protein [Deltaproteobacteria bacterium]